MKKILVVGGGTYQVPLIKRIQEKGNLVYCVDGNPNAPGFEFASEYKHLDVLDKDACLSYAREMGIEAVMTYGATLTLPTVAYIGEKMGLPALPMKTAELSKNKYLIKSCLAENGCNTKGTFFRVTSVEEAEHHTYKFPCVIKPSDGSGSKGVSVVYNESEIKRALDHAFTNARYGEVYVEEFIPGDEYSVEVFVDNGKVYIYAIIKITIEKSGELNESISYGHRTPSGLSNEIENLIGKEVTKAVVAMGVNLGSVNFDIILSKDDGKPYIIDCGVRVGQNLIASHLVPLSRGVSELDNAIALALGETIDATPKQQKCIATRLLIYNPGRIIKIKPMSYLIGNDGIVDIVLRKGVGDTQNVFKEKSDICGWVVSEGSTPDEAERRAEMAKNRLKDYFVISPLQE